MRLSASSAPRVNTSSLYTKLETVSFSLSPVKPCGEESELDWSAHRRSGGEANMLKRDWHQVSMDLQHMLEAMLHARHMAVEDTHDMSISHSMHESKRKAKTSASQGVAAVRSLSLDQLSNWGTEAPSETQPAGRYASVGASVEDVAVMQSCSYMYSCTSHDDVILQQEGRRALPLHSGTTGTGTGTDDSTNDASPRLTSPRCCTPCCASWCCQLCGCAWVYSIISSLCCCFSSPKPNRAVVEDNSSIYGSVTNSPKRCH